MHSEQLTSMLRSKQQRIVFAESCTAGLIAATLGRIPGVSEVLAGSAVVYQLETKTAWLNISAAMLERCGAVSREVSEQMSRGVLATTPHATIAASVTGHLGPDAPAELDGTAWSTVAYRDADQVKCESRKLVLDEPKFENPDGVSLRQMRQQRAADQVMALCIEVLSRQ